MAVLAIALLLVVSIFLFYYELVWKNVERERGKNLLLMARDFAFETKGQSEVMPEAVSVTAGSNPWDDWKYRLLVELHRREQLKPEEAARIVGASLTDIEQYFDELESEGKVNQAGDAARGFFYKVVHEG